MKWKQMLRLAAVALGTVVIGGTTPAIADVVVLNSSFEATELPWANNYSVGSDIDTVPNWTFTAVPPNYSGLVTAGTSPGNTGGLQAFSPFPDGHNAAFVSGRGTFSQTISGFKAGESYVVSFYSSSRPEPYGPQTVEVKMDDKTLTFGADSTIMPASDKWTLYTSKAFSATASAHTLSFTGLMISDVSSFITKVQITTAQKPSKK
jgi:hypothetical protein